MSNRSSKVATVIGGLVCGYSAAHAAFADAMIQPGFEEVQVTATRIPEPVDRLPASVTVIGGEELRQRGAKDLRSALAVVAGVEAPPGGDAGPYSAVPSLWGLHEFDAFLLVVDGIPSGGVFNPALSVLDLRNVQRIEVLKGAAPVVYGATSFVGVIQVIHYPAGESVEAVEVATGRVAHGGRESWNFQLSKNLGSIGAFRHSVSIDANRDNLSGANQGLTRGQILYRGARDLGGGTLGLDVELTAQTQYPTSPVIRAGTALTTRTPLDANFNPSDAGIIEHRARLSAHFDKPTGLVEWHSVLSYTRSQVADVRGFVRRELAAASDGNNADGFRQDRGIDDLYFDTYLAAELSHHLNLTAGVDWLYGRGTQQSSNFAYLAALDGSGSGPNGEPASTSRHIDEINGLVDRRNFAGLYSQVDWQPGERFDVMGGIRLNRAVEQKLSTHLDTIDVTNNFATPESESHTRVTGTAGASMRLWGTPPGAGEGILFADYRQAFKPAAIDFGPDVTPAILHPETTRSYEIGVKGKIASGRVEWEIAGFRLEFRNLVVSQVDPNGHPVLANAGSEKLRGVETQLRWKWTDTWSLSASASYHDVRFGNTLSMQNGQTVQLDGYQLALSPHSLAGFGLIYGPKHGLTASVQTSYIGRQFLDRLNTAPAGGYALLDTRFAYQRGAYVVAVDGSNLSNRRDPVTASEFGDQSYYRMPARRLNLSFSKAL